MKHFEYLETVKKHIKNPKQRSAVEAEYTDHLLFYEAMYEQIGYDEDAACIRAEERMGNAEVAGEQLEALYEERRHRGFLLCVLTAVVLSAVGVLSLVLLMTTKSYYGFLLNTALLLPLGLLAAYGMKRRHPFTVISSLAAMLVLLYAAYNIPHFIFDLFTHRTAWRELFGLEYYQERGLLEALPIALFFGAAMIASLVLKVRLKRFKNTSLDLKIKKAFTVLLLLFTALVAATLCFNAAMGRAEAMDAVQQEARASLRRYDALVTAAPPPTSAAQLKAVSMSVLCDKANWTENYFQEEFRADGYTEYSAYDGDGEPQFEFTLSSLLCDKKGNLCPTCTVDELRALKALTERDDFTVTDIPYPYTVRYVKRMDEAPLLTLGFRFDGEFFDDDCTDYIQFIYRDGAWALKTVCFESLLADGGFTADITAAQKTAIESAIIAYAERPLHEPNANDRYDLWDDGLFFKNPNRNGGKGISFYEINQSVTPLQMVSDLDLLDVHYDQADKVYYADAVLAYDVYTVSDGKVYDFGAVCSPFSYTFTMDDKTVTVLSEQYPTETEVSMDGFYAYCFSPVGNARVVRYDRIGAPSMTTLIEQKTGAKLSGLIDNVYENGDFEYQLYMDRAYSERDDRVHKGHFKKP